MKRIAIASIIVFGLAAVLRAEEAPQITVGLSQAEIFEGQSVIYRIVVENAENPKTPELRGMDDFDVAFLGERSLDSQQITIINGAMRQVVHRGREFHYRLSPKKTGELTIPAPVLTIGGKTVTGQKWRLVVLPPSAQDVVAVELAADRQVVYPTQPFTVTLTVYVKELPAPVSDRDPLSVQKPHPVLRIPWLTDKELPSGLSASEDWQQWVKGFLDHDGVGFGINELVQQSVFSILGESESLAFRPKPKSVSRRDAKGQQAKYHRYDFVRTFTAKQIGPINFGAVTLQGTFADQIAEGGRLSGKEIYAASKPLTILVRDVPKDGRPESYVGAIGHFELSAELSPRQSKVGDPITFTLSLGGAGSLASVKSPDLTRLPAIAARFKVYEATQKTEANKVRFVYALRPLTEGDEPFPAVPVAYFDVDASQYVTVQSDPLPITVTKAERLSGDQIVARPRAAGQTGKELEARREGIYANITDVTAARDQSAHPGGWLLALAVCVATYFLSAVSVVAIRRRTGDKSAVRRRAAVPRARQRLHEAMDQWKAQQFREAADLIQGSLVGLVGDVADLHDAGLTPKDVLPHLQAWAVPQPLVDRVCRLLDACDAARYGGAAASGGLCDEAREVLEAVIAALRTQKRFR